jgi:hypothetical protein
MPTNFTATLFSGNWYGQRAHRKFPEKVLASI